jgi:ankyrin repeat protein
MTLFKWLLDHGANPNKRCRQRDCTSLSLAVRGAPFGTIRLLLQKGGSIQQGQLLHYASIRNKEDNLQVLEFIYDSDRELSESRINKLLDEDYPEFAMNERAGLGTPLHFAALSGSLGMVKFLKEKGADSSIRDPYGRTPISYAVYKGYEDVVQFLQEGNIAQV